MADIECRLFGYPMILENGKEVGILSGKQSALLFYILLKKVVSRDEVAGLFWGSFNEKNAKISLRNALHKIRKNFENDIILSPNKSVLLLNQNIDIFIDVDEFKNKPYENINFYTNDFLRGFYVNNVIEFENWTDELAVFYRGLFIENSEKKIIDNFNKKEYKELEQLINKLISIDSFNEVGYLYLMKLYKENNRYDKLINKYYEFQKLVFEELGIEPSKEIKEIYNDALKYVRNKKSDINGENFNFYNRNFEMQMIQKNMDAFNLNGESRSILIVGETGSGKSILKNEIIKKNKGNFMLYEVYCHALEKKFPFTPLLKIIRYLEEDLSKNNLEKPFLWEDILRNLFFDSIRNIQPSVNIIENKENFNLDLIYNTLNSAFNILAKKVVIILEDIQWADQLTIHVLINLILHSNRNVLFFLTKSNEDNEKIDKLLTPLIELEKLLFLKLKPFNRDEVEIIIRNNIKKPTRQDVEEIYKKSKGNAFFLKEYIELFKKGEKDKLISTEVKNLLYEKFVDLEEKEMNFLKVVSVFYSEVSLDILLKVLNMKAFEILEILDFLERMEILEEKEEKGEIIINFTYSLYKHYIYSNLSPSFKKVINKEIAKILEKENENKKDISIYSKLKYHYSESKDSLKALKYDIYILSYHLNFIHEMFPDLDDFELTKQVKLFISNEKGLKWINDIERELYFLKNLQKNKDSEKEIKEIELIFLYCKGRYLIRMGNYTEGINVINKVIILAKDIKDISIEISGYKQLIIYGIQISNAKIIFNNVVKGIKVAKQNKKNSDIGVLYRLYGVYYLISGKIESAELYFRKSIDFLKNLKRFEMGNSVSIAASFNYIGEIYKSNCEYQSALDYFMKSVELCKNSGVACLSIFYINIAKTNFLLGNVKNMKKYIFKAKEIVDYFDSYWRSSVVNCYLALSYFILKDFKYCMQYLKNAEFEMNILNNPRDFGMVFFIKTIIKFNIDKNYSNNCREIYSFLNRTVDYYYCEAVKYLDKNRDSAELKYLKNLVESK